MGELDGALAELDTAERLTPDSTGEGIAWAGTIWWHRRDIAKAREKFARVSGRVTGTTLFRTAELEAIALCGLGQADKAERHLLEALPSRIAEHQTEIQALYDLLLDPPMPGIDRLRAIANGEA
jgi:hypothetical protein